MEYKKCEYDEIIERISKIINNYENSSINENVYTLFLANGDAIKYSFKDFNICHLLGIDFTKLIAYGIYEREKYYDLLKKMIDDPYKCWSKIVQGGIKMSDIFSKYINEKLENFEVQFSIPFPNSIYFVCKYDRERNYASKAIDSLSADYYIARKNNDGDIVLLGLIKSEKDNIYIPQTSRIIKNDDYMIDNLTDLLNNQVLTYTNGLTIENSKTGYNRKCNLNTLEIMDALDKLCSLKEETGAIPCTISDHIYNLKNFKKNRSSSYEGRNLLYEIEKQVKLRQIINLTELDKSVLSDASIISIIDTYNDLLVSNNENDTSATYTEVKSENERMKEELIRLKEELLLEQNSNKKLMETIESKDSIISGLEEEKEDYLELKDKVKTLYSSLK